MTSNNGNQQGTLASQMNTSSGPSPMLPMIGSYGGGGGTANNMTLPNANRMPPRVPQQANSAVMYLDDVKREFIDQPDIYNEFLAVMKEFKSGGLDTVGVRARVMELFKGHRKVLLGFNAFLPPNCAITEHDMEELPRTAVHTLATPSSSMSMSAPMSTQRFVGQRSMLSLPQPPPAPPPPPNSAMGMSYSGMPIGMDYGAHYANEAMMSSFRGSLPTSGVVPGTPHHGPFRQNNGPSRSSVSLPPTSSAGGLGQQQQQQTSMVPTTMGLQPNRGGAGSSLLSNYASPSSMGGGSSASLWPPMGPAGMMSTGPPMGGHFPGPQQASFGGPATYGSNQPGSYGYQGPPISSFHAMAMQGHSVSHQPQDLRPLPPKQLPAEQANPEFTKAVDFVRRVRARFSNRPKIYEEFLETLRGGSADQFTKLSPEEVCIYIYIYIIVNKKRERERVCVCV
jgi:histone deacetylase complex regulatory component SIN3